MSNWPPGVRNFSRLKLARLHAESSRNMYSLQGFDALMRAVFFDVCHLLIVVSYCMPGSPHCHVASAILCIRSRARYSFTGSRPFTVRVEKVPSESTASMNSSVTRTELFAFWKKIELYASLSGPDPSYPACTRCHAFFSSFTLHSMKSSISGWSMLSTTIFAARRVLPPDLITPANASNPRMNDSGPDAVPPPESVSIEPRIELRFDPAPDPHLNSMPSVFASVRIESSESFTELMKHAEHCGFE